MKVCVLITPIESHLTIKQPILGVLFSDSSYIISANSMKLRKLENGNIVEKQVNETWGMPPFFQDGGRC